MFSAEEKWWTDYASSEAGAESLSKGHIKNMLSALGCFPMTQEMAYALSGLAHWHWIDMSVGILIGFDCLLRTGALLQLRIADIMMKIS